MTGKILYYLSFGVQFLIEFCFIALLSKKLSGDDFFIINQINYALPYLIIIINFGTAYATLYLSSYNFTSKIKDQANLINIVVSLFLVALFTILFTITSSFNYFIFASIISLFYAIRQNYNSYYLAGSSHKRAAISRLSQKFLVLCLTLIYFASLSNQEIRFDFLFFYLSFEIIAFLLTLKINPLPKSLSLDKSKSILIFSRFAFLSNLYGVAFSALPSFLISERHFSKYTITSFLLSLTLLRYFAAVIAPAFQIISPSITRKKNNISFLKDYIKKYDLILFLFGVLCWFIIRYFGEYFLVMFYPKYNVYEYFKIISISLPFLFVSSLQSSIISALGIVKKKNLTELVLLIFFGFLMYFIIKENNLNILCYIYIGYYFFKIIVNKFIIIHPYLRMKTKQI